MKLLFFRQNLFLNAVFFLVRLTPLIAIDPFSSNTAFSKDLSKDKITLTFKVNDIFETGKWRIESFNENYKSYSESNWRGGRTLELNLIYRFNQKKKQSRNSDDYNDYSEGGFGA